MAHKDQNQAEAAPVRDAPELRSQFGEQVIEAVPDGVCIFDPEGRVIYANRAAEKILGLSRQEMLHRSYNDPMWKIHGVDDDSGPGEDLPVARVLKNGEDVQGIRFAIENQDGRRWILSVNAAALKDKDGRLSGVVATFADVTEKYLSDSRLKDSEKKYRELYQSNRDGYVLLDMDGRIVEYNQTFKEMLGYSDEEILNLRYPDITPGKWHDMEMEITREQILKRGYSNVYEKEYIRKDGSIFPISIRSYQMRDAKGTPLGIWAFVRDISEQKRAEEIANIQRELGAVLGSAVNMDEILRECLYAAIQVSRLDSGGIYLFDDASGDLILRCHLGLSDEFIRNVKKFHHDAPSIKIIKAGQPVYNRHEQLEVLADEIRKKEDLKAIAVIPIHFKGEIIGCLNVASHIIEDVPINSREALEVISIQIGNVAGRARAEQALRESEEKYRLLIETMNEGVIMADKDGMVIYVNERACQISGYSREEVLGQPFQAFFDADDIRKMMEQRAKRLKGEIGPYEVEGIIKNGRFLPILISPADIKDENGNLKASIAVFLDISERKHAEKVIQERERFLSDIFSSIQDGISILDNEMNIIGVNATMDRWYPHAMPLVGKKCYQAYHGRDTFCTVCPSRQTLSSGKPAREVVPLTGTEGKIQGWLDLYSFPLLDTATGYLKGVIEYVRDITDKAQAEEALRLSEERYRNVVENANEAIIILQDGIVKYFNPKAELIIGHSLFQIPRQDLFSYTHPDDRQMIINNYGNYSGRF